MNRLIMFTFVIIFALLGCSEEQNQKSNPVVIKTTNFTLSSPAFAHNDTIPSIYTCDGRNISPELNWDNIPNGTKSLAIVLEDSDAPAGVWVHWLLFNIPPNSKRIPERIAPKNEFENGMIHGLNDNRINTYSGPCPHKGMHNYEFKLYALSKVLRLDPKSSKIDFDEAVKDCIIGVTNLKFKYKRLNK